MHLYSFVCHLIVTMLGYYFESWLERPWYFSKNDPYFIWLYFTWFGCPEMGRGRKWSPILKIISVKGNEVRRRKIGTLLQRKAYWIEGKVSNAIRKLLQMQLLYAWLPFSYRPLQSQQNAVSLSAADTISLGTDPWSLKMDGCQLLFTELPSYRDASQPTLIG